MLVRWPARNRRAKIYFREATALVERIELVPRSRPADRSVGSVVNITIVAGFRADGALSVFFGEDPVYHFNAAGELRRAYVDGLLFKATQGHLISLRRVRGEGQVQLVRHELTSLELSAFLAQMTKHLNDLRNRLVEKKLEMSGQVPAEGNTLRRLQLWLENHHEYPVAARPNV